MHEYVNHLRINASFGAKVSTHFITTAAKCASVHKSQTKESDMSLKVGIVGAAGYAGAEPHSPRARSSEFELVAITSNADAGQPLSAVYPSFAGVSDLVSRCMTPRAQILRCGLLAVPHTAAMAQVPALLASGVSCFDLSADYRLSDPSVFEAWYAAEHTSPELLKTRAFGLPELFSRIWRPLHPTMLPASPCWSPAPVAIPPQRALPPRPPCVPAGWPRAAP